MTDLVRKIGTKLFRFMRTNACKNSGETGEVFDLSTINSIYNSTLKMAKNCKECNVKRQLLFLYSLNAHVIKRLASCKGEKLLSFVILVLVHLSILLLI